MSDTREDPATEPADARQPGDAEDQIGIDVRAAGAGRTVVAVSGEVDMLTSPRLRATILAELHERGVTLLVLDLDGITFLGTTGLAVLIETREAAQAAGVELHLVCSGRRVLRPLAIAGLEPLFAIHATQDAALGVA